MKTFSDINEFAEYLSEHMAEIKGEALAGRVIATFALDWLVSRSTDPKQSLDALETEIDKSLNSMTHYGGDDDLNARVREVARLRSLEMLGEIRRRRGS